MAFHNWCRLAVLQSVVKSVITRCLISVLIGLLSIGYGSSQRLAPSLAQGSDQVSDQATAKVSAPTAEVVIDGRVLFRLGSIDGFSAQRRANSVNTDLQQALQATPLDQSIPVNVARRNDLTTLWLDERHLLTVTESDFMRGVSPTEQARKWETLLNRALTQAQKERSPGYYRAAIWRIVLAFVSAIALYSSLRWLRRRLWRQSQNQRASPEQQPSSYLKRLRQPALLCLQGGVWLAFLGYLCEQLPRARIARYNTLRFLSRTFTSNLLNLGEQTYSLLDICQLILLVTALWLAIRGLTALIKSRFLQATVPDRGLQDAIATLIQVGLTSIGLFIVLQAWGIDLSGLAILASVLGVGLGFGLQNIANNFISGWILLIERPLQVGDFINIGELMGTVEHIGARSTELRSLDRVSIIVPNAELVQTRVINWSHRHPVSRIHLPLGVAYGSTINQVHTAAIEAAQTHPKVLRYPRPQLRFLGFGDSSLDFELLIWTRDPRQQFDIKSDVYYLLETNFRRYNIEIPFPQRDLNFKSPQLQAIVNANQKSGVPQSSIEYAPIKQSTPQTVSTEQQTSSPAPANLLAEVIRYSAILNSPKGIATSEVDRLIAQMRDSDGLTISDRRFRLSIYPNCFVGSEAVTWIVKTQNATREAAVRLGQLLVERGIIHHVTDEHAFKDDYLFYRFYEDELPTSPSSDPLEPSI